MKLLVISRKYPPSIGGMQEYAYQFIRHMRQQATVYQIAHPVPLLLFPAFCLYAFVRSVLMRRAVECLYLCDGALAPLGLVLKLVTRKPAAICVHGLDLVYGNWLYQLVVPFCLRRLDTVFCDSTATKMACVKRGIREERLCLIPLGISDELHRPRDKALFRRSLVHQYGLSPKTTALLSVGRLIERKGFHWFLAEVMPRILNTRPDATYLLVGSGPLEGLLRRLIDEKDLSSHVRLLGAIPDSALALLYNAADLFIMPNVPVCGDLEGFGLVALEAASCGLPVVASRLDGIQDAIKDGENGFLVEPLNPTQFAELILSLIDHDEQLAAQVRRYTLETYSWERTVERYRQRLGDLIASAP